MTATRRLLGSLLITIGLAAACGGPVPVPTLPVTPLPPGSVLPGSVPAESVLPEPATPSVLPTAVAVDCAAELPSTPDVSPPPELRYGSTTRMSIVLACGTRSVEYLTYDRQATCSYDKTRGEAAASFTGTTPVRAVSIAADGLGEPTAFNDPARTLTDSYGGSYLLHLEVGGRAYDLDRRGNVSDSDQSPLDFKDSGGWATLSVRDQTTSGLQITISVECGAVRRTP